MDGRIKLNIENDKWRLAPFTSQQVPVGVIGFNNKLIYQDSFILNNDTPYTVKQFPFDVNSSFIIAVLKGKTLVLDTKTGSLKFDVGDVHVNNAIVSVFHNCVPTLNEQAAGNFQMPVDSSSNSNPFQ